MSNRISSKLDERLGGVHARRRLDIEAGHDARVSARRFGFLRFESWTSSPALIGWALRLAGLQGRARRNAEDIQLRHNSLRLAGLPPAFDGFTLLHITDPHADISPRAMRRLEAMLPGLDYDVAVLTGDYRGATFGPFEPSLDALERVCRRLSAPVYGVLGNHDTIRMVPRLEKMGIRMLLNECVTLSRGSESIHLAGIDDAHYYRLDNIDKATAGIPEGGLSVLLSHTPEVYRQAARAGFALLLAGHTHGGQICLPRGIAMTLDAVLPRHMGAGAWRYGEMAGYTSTGVGTSVLPVRLNCLPEITLHHLHKAR